MKIEIELRVKCESYGTHKKKFPKKGVMVYEQY